MPTTTTERSASQSTLVTVVLVFGLVALSIGPLSCGTETDNASSEEASQATGGGADRAVLLNIGVEDETEERPLSDQFLLETPEGTQWTPGDLEGAGATKAFEEYSVGETRTLSLYPEGEEGPRLEVPITMRSDMSSALASSRTNVFVYDDSIVVEGPAVPDGERRLERSPASSNAP